MNAINHAVDAIFDALLRPLELLGRPAALVIVAGIFGVGALILFKRISSQRGIKSTKDKIKAHLIEIRIYQDDLAIVGRAIGKILVRNAQYLALNFGPFIPLSIPFVIVLAQLVTRYAYAPLAVHGATEVVLPGKGTLIEVELARDKASLVQGLKIEYPAGIRALSPLVRIPSDARAYQEVVATSPGEHELAIVLGDGTRATKSIVAGTPARSMQPERARGFFAALLWPAEDSFASDSPLERVSFTYPDGDLGWFPGGPTGVLIVFLVASMVFGAIVMKPLGIEI
jgi:hypothetical protein